MSDHRPVIAPADRRFLRARPRTGRRRRAWRHGAIVALRTALIVAAGVYAGMHVARAAQARGLFEIRHIVVSGADWLSEDEVLGMLEDLRGRSMLRTDLETWRQRLLTSPWVAEATVRRRVPSTAVVSIVERHPMGVARRGRELVLVGPDGAFMGAYGPRYAALDLPIIEGLAGAGADLQADLRRVALARRVLQALESRPDLLRRVSDIDVSDPRDAVLVLEGDAARLRLGDREFAERLAAYIDLAPTLREHVTDIRYVDLRFGRQVFVEPSRGAGGGSKE